ncbi:MAG: outer membrane protein assembly factor BamD [Longimicrobiaceae bacterium]
MPIHIRRDLAPLLAAALLLAGCASKEVDLATVGPDDLYQRGMAAFRTGEHDQALRYLEYFVEAHFGDERVPRAQFTVGEAYRERREYLEAAAAFQRLVASFPTHQLAPLARLATCEAYVELSPPPPLYQQYTRTAITFCQAVIANYPQTEWAESAAAKVSAMRERLALKSYQTGEHYLSRKAYDAAVIYFERTVDEFPRTSSAPAALLRLVESYRELGYDEEAAETRERLLREYPESEEAGSLRGDDRS